MQPKKTSEMMSLTQQTLILPLLLTLSACSYFQHKESTTPPPPAATTAEVTPAAVTTTEKPAEKEKSSDKSTEKPPTETQAKASEPPVAAPAAPEAVAAKPTQEVHHHHPEAAGVPADKALGWLKNGNNRYLTNKLRTDGQNAKDRQRLSTGQHPHAIILSCSDSRVPPEILFDQKLGEIFVVRAAGEVLDSSTIASIEYAVAHLGSNLLVVMGHDSCGAIKAAYETLGGADAGSPFLNNLVKDIHPRIQSFVGKKLSDHGVDESWANVHGIAKNLIERSAIVREAVANNGFKIAKSVYHLSSGQVEWKE